MGYIAGVDSIYTLTRGRKKYEASNHLGNVMVVFTDKRINQCINDSVRYYRADLRSAYDYYPFGMLIPDRTFDSVAYVQLPDRVDTTINQRIKIQIPTLNPGQIISLSKDGETYVLAQYQSGYTGAQYSAIIAGSAIVNELSFEDSAGYLIIENTTLGGQSICSGIPSFSLNIAGTNYVVNCSQSIDTIRGGLLSEAGYLFGINGMEKENNLKGLGNSYTTLFREFDPRIGRWLSLDPAKAKYPSQSPYSSFNNNPIFFSDPLGNEPPEGFVKHTGQNGDVYLPESSQTISRENCVTGIQELAAFTIGKRTFTEKTDESGNFLGYFDGETKYENPDIIISKGGITENNYLDVTFQVYGVNASSLQVIQTVMATGSMGFNLPKYEFQINRFGKSIPFGGFVDGGRNSAWVLIDKREPAHETKPYYLIPLEVNNQVFFDKKSQSGTIRVKDEPGATWRAVIRFETIIIAVNYMGSGKDLILGTFVWGWADYLKIPLHNEDRTITIHGVTPSQYSLNILKFDYPDYKFFGE